MIPSAPGANRSRHYNSWPIGCWSYLMRSRYAEQLERWFALLPRDQFHFLTMEEIAEDQQRGDGWRPSVPSAAAAPVRRPAPLHTATYDAITPEARAQLTEYFRPHNERLYELLGVDFGWEQRPESRLPSQARPPSRSGGEHQAMTTERIDTKP